MCSVIDPMRDIIINRKVADVAVVAGIGRPIPVFSFAALKAFNTSNDLHLRLMRARGGVFLAVLYSQYSVLSFTNETKMYCGYILSEKIKQPLNPKHLLEAKLAGIKLVCRDENDKNRLFMNAVCVRAN
jgi:hypothetical protein